MHRKFSSMVKPSKEDSFADDAESKTSTVVRDDGPPPSLKIKRVDHYYSRWSKSWKYRDTNAKVTVESLPILKRGDNDPWKDFLFVVVRDMQRRASDHRNDQIVEPVLKVVIKSEYILKACKDVIQSWPGVSWNTDPLELDTEIFLTFLQEFTDYRDALVAKQKHSDVEHYVLQSVNVLLSWLNTDYANTIAKVKNFKAHGEISNDMLYAILVPRSIMVAHCAVTGLPRLFKLVSWTRLANTHWLNCESVDLVDMVETQTVAVGKVRNKIILESFKGTIKIRDLAAYPVQYHPEPGLLKESITLRGKKWVGLIGVYHKEFDGVAAIIGENRLIRQTVKGRIMVDRATFRRFNPNYQYPVAASETAQDVSICPLPTPIPVTPIPGRYRNNDNLVYSNLRSEQGFAQNPELSDEDLLFTPTTVYGFSLTDKLWLEFNIDKISDVQWDVDAFSNLVLPEGRKELLQSLVEAHHRGLEFDDFIKGKGQGLVINLFGPPGVGKTFSAEATSEHMKRPLYLVGASDLGSDAAAMDLALEKVFEVATAWKAIVLIDEADVFLEQRSLHDLKRNAMVTVFLRHVEYYRGILFLTTNRVKAFDEAFLSRIHVALHFHELSFESKVQVWSAFIARVGASSDITPEQIRTLAEKNVNGRQIKNAARTAQSLAAGKGEKLSLKHLLSTLNSMDEFTREFEAIRAKATV